MRTLSLSILWLLSASSLVAQEVQSYDSTNRYSIQQLQADFTFLRNVLEEAHPSLYWYTSKDSMNYYFGQTFRAIDRPMNEQEYWKLIQPLVVKIHCGHTRIFHTNAYQTWFRKQPKFYFPFSVAVIDNRLFVVENQSTDSTLITGTEVLTIEGYPVKEVLEKMRSYISGDGYIKTFKDKEMEFGFFDEYYWAAYEAKPVYQLQIRDQFGNTRTITPERKKRSPASAAAEKNQAVTLTPEQEREKRLSRLRSVSYPEDLPSTALLRISSFSYDDKEDYKTFHANFFQSLEKHRIKNLIVDLRGNVGGSNAIGIDLMKYLVYSKFILTKSAIAPVFAPSFMRYAEEGKGIGFDTSQVKRVSTGKFSFTAPTVGEQLPYKSHHFEGNIYLLTDGSTFSAASNFAASLRAQRKIVVVGQETGGGEAGLNGGSISRIVLQETHLILQFPHFRLLTAFTKPNIGRGVLPDIEVIPTPDQRVKHIDAVLLKLKTILR